MTIKLADTTLLRTIVWFAKLITEDKDANIAYNDVCTSYYKTNKQLEVDMTVDLHLLSKLGPYRDSMPLICYLMALMEEPAPMTRKQIRAYHEIVSDGEMSGFGILPILGLIILTQGTKQDAHKEVLKTNEFFPKFQKNMMLAWEYIAYGEFPESLSAFKLSPNDIYMPSYLTAAANAGFIMAMFWKKEKELEKEIQMRKEAERGKASAEQREEQAIAKTEKQKAELTQREEAVKQEREAFSKEKNSVLTKLERAEALLSQRESEISELRNENKFLLKENDALLQTMESIDAQAEESYEPTDSVLSRIDGRVVIAGIMEPWRNRMVEAFQKNGVDAVTVPPGQELDTLKKKDILVLNIRAYKHSNAIPLRSYCMTNKVPQVLTSATNFNMLLIDIKRQLFKERSC